MKKRLQGRKIKRGTTWKVITIVEARDDKAEFSGGGGEKWQDACFL